MRQLTWDEIRDNALRFKKRWQGASNEEAQAQSFQIEFLRVFGIDDPEAIGGFEYKVPLEDGHNGYIDYLWKQHIAIEMKSRGKNLKSAYEQLKNYVIHLPAEDMPELLMVCDFETIVLYHRTAGTKKQFKTKELQKHIRRFANIAGYETTREIEDQIEVNVKASEKMAKLHDALKAHGYEGHDLEVYLVRLLFCLFAEDTGIFSLQSFLDYVANSREDGSDLANRIARLFEILDMTDDVRNKRTLLTPELKQFRYINGSLFEKPLPHADFDANMRQTLLDCCFFDWSKISPAIFGAMFQGVMDSVQRRELGAHYTSEENILKLINPLFLDELWQEFERVKIDPKQLERFHDKISQLKFLDPACGCGNFLIITYRELRRLELEVLKMKLSQFAYKQGGWWEKSLEKEIRVNVNQFYGIELEDFPGQIAPVGMWLMDHQMNNVVAEHFGLPFVRLPLTKSATIVHGNALRINWESVVPKSELSYILGNPPFVGASMMNSEQKNDAVAIFGEIPRSNSLDYVGAWYHKASVYIQETTIKVAFVSTNSITQGEQVAPLWEKLLVKYNIQIIFGYRTFKWSNEAKGKAAVHCVIIGFCGNMLSSSKHIYEGDTTLDAKNISPYLVDSPIIFVQNSRSPICDVPKMSAGNKPSDGGNLIFPKEEKTRILDKEPELATYIHPYIGATEFINKKQRYCFWLRGVSPVILRQSTELKARLDAVKKMREKSSARPTIEKAATPHLFFSITQPKTSYLAIPEVSSERRKYIPIGFMTPDIIASNKLLIIPDATLYHFGVLTSNIHMAWMRAVCGRMKSDYQYSGSIVYNNFSWPEPTDTQKAAIESAAQGILDTRDLFPDSSLADLYDPLTMPPELLKAHQKLDNAVMKAYGYSAKDFVEAHCVADLMQRYKRLTE